MIRGVEHGFQGGVLIIPDAATLVKQTFRFAAPMVDEGDLMQSTWYEPAKPPSPTPRCNFP
jgi:hypothetical protein